LRDNWNRLDFVIVVAAALDLALVNNPTFQAVRALRALRPLRLVAKIEGAKVAVIAMFRSLKPISLVAAMVCVFLVIFALFGVVLFGGLYYSCLDSSARCIYFFLLNIFVNASQDSPFDGISNWGIYYDSFVNPETGMYNVDRLCFPYRSYDVKVRPFFWTHSILFIFFVLFSPNFYF